MTGLVGTSQGHQSDTLTSARPDISKLAGAISALTLLGIMGLGSYFPLCAAPLYPGEPGRRFLVSMFVRRRH